MARNPNQLQPSLPGYRKLDPPETIAIEHWANQNGVLEALGILRLFIDDFAKKHSDDAMDISRNALSQGESMKAAFAAGRSAQLLTLYNDLVAYWNDTSEQVLREEMLSGHIEIDSL